MVDEIWRVIQEFPNYEISNLGNVLNLRTERLMRTSNTGFGHVKITLVSEYDGKRYTRSVAQMVAKEFVSPPNALCDHLVILDGDFENVCADNLVWRPRGFAWKYTHQLKEHQPVYYRNLMVRNLLNDEVYGSIIEAGMSEGLLFDDVWRSTYTGDRIFPHGSVFEVVQDREYEEV